MSWWLTALGVSLGLTLLLELALALVCGIRGLDLVFVALANMMTNPPVVFLVLLCRMYTAWPEWLYTLPAELAAVAVEALVYRYGAVNIRHPFRFSLAANAFSYFCGLLLSVFL